MLLTFRITKSNTHRAARQARSVFTQPMASPTLNKTTSRLRLAITPIVVPAVTGLFLSTVSLLAPSIVVAAESQQDAIRLNRCLDEIDLVTRHHDFTDSDSSEQKLKALEYSCSHVPQLHHNLGVIAAAKLEWKEAIAYLEKSLSLDKRAALTQQSLASIYQFKASLAYKKALNLSEKIKLPVLTMQTSALTNLCRADATPLFPQPDVIIPASLELTAPESIVTKMDSSQPLTDALINEDQIGEAVRYDVGSWWTAILEQDEEALPAHYIDADTITLPLDERLVFPWNSLTVAIEFVDRIALVSITYPPSEWAKLENNPEKSSVKQHKHDVLLVMKEQDNMWKIVREEQI